MLPGALTVIGIFMLGASAGSLVTYAKCRVTIGELRRSLKCLAVNDMRQPEDAPVVRQAVRTDATDHVEEERWKNRKSNAPRSPCGNDQSRILFVVGGKQS